MTKPIAKWVQIRYSKLWNKFRTKEFTFEQAKKAIKGKSEMSMFLSELKKAGWLQISLSSEDTRKRLYKLKDPGIAIKEMTLV